MQKNIKIALIAAAILLLVIAVAYLLIIEGAPEEESKIKPEVAKEEVIKKTQEQIGGVIIERGFNISYESGANRIIITVTDIPFAENENKALDYLQDIGVDICLTNIITLGGGGIIIPEGHRSRLDECR